MSTSVLHSRCIGEAKGLFGYRAPLLIPMITARETISVLSNATPFEHKHTYFTLLVSLRSMNNLHNYTPQWYANDTMYGVVTRQFTPHDPVFINDTNYGFECSRAVPPATFTHCTTNLGIEHRKISNNAENFP